MPPALEGVRSHFGITPPYDEHEVRSHDVGGTPQRTHVFGCHRILYADTEKAPAALRDNYIWIILPALAVQYFLLFSFHNYFAFAPGTKLRAG